MIIAITISILIILIILLLIWPIIILGPYSQNEGLKLTQPTNRQKHVLYSFWTKNPLKSINSYIKSNIFNNLQVNNLIIDNNLNQLGSLYIILI